MVSLLNGLSAAGAGIAQFAGTAGLEAQRADLQRQSVMLSADLAHTNRMGEIGMEQAGAQTLETQRAAAGLAQTTLAGQTSLAVAAAEAASRQKTTQMTIDAELDKLKQMANLPTPEQRDVTAYTGGAKPGTPEYQQGVKDLLLLKAGIDPSVYGTGGVGSATAPAPSGGAATPPAAGGAGATTPPPPPPGTTPAAGAVAPYKPILAGLDHGAPPGGYNESALVGQPQWIVNTVHAKNEGREEPFTERSLSDYKSPEYRVHNILLAYNPNYDATLYAGRLEAWKAIQPGGSQFVSISAMNTSMGHAEHLNDLYQQLGNYNGGAAINMPLNEIAANFGQYPVINEIKQTVHAMAEEGNKIYAGNAGTETAIKQWEDTFPLNGSPAEQAGAIKNFTRLMGAKFTTMTAQINAAAGLPGKAPIELLTPEAKATYLRILAPPNGGTLPAGGGGGAAPPATDQKNNMTPAQMYGGAPAQPTAAPRPAPAAAAPSPAVPVWTDRSKPPPLNTQMFNDKGASVKWDGRNWVPVQ